MVAELKIKQLEKSNNKPILNLEREYKTAEVNNDLLTGSILEAKNKLKKIGSHVTL